VYGVRRTQPSKYFNLSGGKGAPNACSACIITACDRPSLLFPLDHWYQIHSQYPPLPFSSTSPSLLLPPPPASPSLPLLSSAARTRRRVPQVLIFFHPSALCFRPVFQQSLPRSAALRASSHLRSSVHNSEGGIRFTQFLHSPPNSALVASAVSHREGYPVVSSHSGHNSRPISTRPDIHRSTIRCPCGVCPNSRLSSCVFLGSRADCSPNSANHVPASLKLFKVRS